MISVEKNVQDFAKPGEAHDDEELEKEDQLFLPVAEWCQGIGTFWGIRWWLEQKTLLIDIYRQHIVINLKHQRLSFIFSVRH